MAFRCGSCRIVQRNGTKANKVVTQVRRVIYPKVRDAEGRFRTPEGYETVKEVTVCPNCVTKRFEVEYVGVEKVIKEEEDVNEI